MSNMLGKSGEPWTHGCCNACAKDSKYKPRKQTIRQGRAREKRATVREIHNQTALPGDLADPICPVDLDICDDCMAC